MPAPLNSFVGYRRRDNKWLEELQLHLKPLVRKGQVDGPSLFQQTQSLSVFQAVNDPQKPLARLQGWRRDEVFVRLTTQVVEAWTARQAPHETPPPAMAEKMEFEAAAAEQASTVEAEPEARTIKKVPKSAAVENGL